jgi:hypothetical protein
MPESSTKKTRIRRLQFAYEMINCPDCCRARPARLVMRENGSGAAIVACLGCRHLFPAQKVLSRSGLGS